MLPPAPKLPLADVEKLGNEIVTAPLALETGPQVGLHKLIPVTTVLIDTELDATVMVPPLMLKSTLFAKAVVGSAKANNANKTTRLMFAPP
jgi:hypothetical protein